jgi:ACS family glucarate transporter-like MFS transporter
VNDPRPIASRAKITNRPTSVRWLILAMICAFGLVSYVERMNISISAELIMPDLSLDKTEMGQIFTAFLIGYAIFQVPGGILGDTVGPRLILTLAALSWGITTMLTGLVPGLAVRGRTGIFVSLWLIRFLLGAGEAATFPVAARAVRNWMPAGQRALGNSIMLAGTTLAAVVTGPLVSWLMLRVGWRQSFYITSTFAFVIAFLWYRHATDQPEQHPGVNRLERELIRPAAGTRASQARPQRFWSLLADRKVLFLSFSYICEGYVLFIFVFWLYIYLVDVRGFSMLKGGLVSSLPWITALVFTPFGGAVTDRLSTYHGRLAGARYVIMLGYGLSGILLFAAADSANRNLAVAALCLSVGFLYFSEPAFWTTALYLSRDNAGALSGIMNTAGIVGGIVSTSLVPVLVKHFGWLIALSSGAAMAIACTLAWWLIKDSAGRESIDPT